MYKKKGMILHEGSGRVVILTYNSTNQKTGDMAQVIILNRFVNPCLAAKTGQDSVVCGNCNHRPIANGTCYVNLAFAPSNIYRAYKAGLYSTYDPVELEYKLRYSTVRFGSYGDPSFIPISIVEKVISYCSGYTGYTHLWKEKHAKEHMRYFMASVDNNVERDEALNRGYKTFRVLNTSESVDKALEVICPNTTYGVTCTSCLLCSAEQKSKNIAVTIHGLSHKIVKFNGITK